MATYQQGDDHDRITHVDMLNLLRQDMREGFAQQREAFNARFDALSSRFDALGNKIDARFDELGSRFDALDDNLDALGCKVDGIGGKLDVSIAEHAKEADERKKERPLLIGIAIGVAITAVVSVSEFVVQHLPAIIHALQSGQ